MESYVPLGLQESWVVVLNHILNQVFVRRSTIGVTVVDFRFLKFKQSYCFCLGDLYA